MRDQAIYSRAKTHLSNSSRSEAENCFEFLAANAKKSDNTKSMGGMGGIGGRGARVPRVSVKIAAKDAHALLRGSPRGPSTPRRHVSQTIHIDQVDKAMFPLNLFPTHDELKEMHEKYTQSRNRIDLVEFIDMVEHLTFAEIDESTRANLYGMYKNACQEDHRGLTREALKNLMFSMHNEHSEEEVDQIMMDWDMHGTGRVPFESFLSIIAMDLKQEEKEREFEKDFERFCPHFVRDSDIEDDSQRITLKNLMDVFKDLDVPLTEDVAEEMIFDADLSKLEGRVSYDDLICTIEIITSKELYEALESQKGLQHEANEDKTVLYQSMLHLYDGKKS